MTHIYDSFIKKVEILSKALEKATERTRTMLYVVTFFSLLILVTSFNAYLAWDRKLNAQERLFSSVELKLIPASSLKPYNKILASRLRNSSIAEYKNITEGIVDSKIGDIINDMQVKYNFDTVVANSLDEYSRNLEDNHLLLSQSDYLKLFLDRQKFTIPLIGLTCYADDLYLIGGLGLVILLTYSFFSVRRENRIVERIANTIDYINERNPKEFLDSNSYNETEIDLIRHNLLEYVFYGCVEFFIFNTGLTKADLTPSANNKEKKERTNFIGRWILSSSYYLPIFAMLFALFFEIKSFHDRHSFINSSDSFELYVRYTFAAIFLFTNCYQCIIINKLNRVNSELIGSMYKVIGASRSKLGLS